MASRRAQANNRVDFVWLGHLISKGKVRFIYWLARRAHPVMHCNAQLLAYLLASVRSALVMFCGEGLAQAWPKGEANQLLIDIIESELKQTKRAI